MLRMTLSNVIWKPRTTMRPILNHQTEFYKICARLIPQQREVSGPDGQPVQSELMPIDKVPRAATFEEWVQTKVG